MGSVLALNESVALSPLPPPAIPPDIRFTVGLKETAIDEILYVYRAFGQAAGQAELTCEPTIKDYDSWREKGFEPAGRTMACHDSHHTVLIDASWVNAVPKLITIDFRFGSQAEPAMKRLAHELEKSLKADPSVTSLVQETWSPEHLSTQLK